MSAASPTPERRLPHGRQVLAQLIKTYLRRLPPPGILGGAPPELLAACADGGGKLACEALLEALPRAERGCLEWLVRVVLEVHAQREANKMRLKSLTVVFAPNLYLIAPERTAAPDPRQEMLLVERVEGALHALCTQGLKLWRTQRD